MMSPEVSCGARRRPTAAMAAAAAAAASEVDCGSAR
jgi:hypothetical protein